MPLLPIALGIGALAILVGGAGAAYVGNTAVNNWTNPSPQVPYDPNATVSNIDNTILYAALGLGALYLLTRD